MKDTAPTGGNRREMLARVLQRSGDFVTVDATSVALKTDRSTAAQTLARWNRQGWIRRVRRGLYVPVPVTASRMDRVIEDAWILIPEVFGSAYVGGATAAHHWDLTEQLFRTLFVFTTRPVRDTDQTIEGVPFSVHHIPDDHFFGTRSVWRGGVKVQVSDVDRTVVDLLNAPGIGGGGRHVAECVAAYFQRDDANGDRLIEYAERLGNGAVFKRLGFLAEWLHAPEALLEACRARLTKGNARLDPAIPAGRLVRRWRLWVPARWPSAAR